MIHLEPPAAVKLHGEYAERLELPEGSQNALEVFGRHTRILGKYLPGRQAPGLSTSKPLQILYRPLKA